VIHFKVVLQHYQQQPHRVKPFRKLFITLKGLESDLSSISPKVISVREKIKKQISEIQLRINKIREENK
jgi:hypothetical protein